MLTESQVEEWEQHLEEQRRATERAGGTFTQMNKMKLKLQWEIKIKLQTEHEKLRMQKSFGKAILKMKPEQSTLDQ